MDYVRPQEVAESFLNAAVAKSKLSIFQMLVRGILSGALLGFSTSVAFTITAQGLPPVVGAVLFPVGFSIIVLLGLELVTGNFAILPAALLGRRVGFGVVLRNLCWVFAGNLIGGLLYAWMFAQVQTQFHHAAPTPAGALIVAATVARTIGYQKLGGAGLALSFLKAILCNWMVCLAVVMGFTSRSTLGKILGCWLPIFTFFALGYEHSVVNMFLFPCGIMMGAPVPVSTWWLWNEIPITIGNLFGGFLFVGLPMLWLARQPSNATQTVLTEEIPDSQAMPA
jgi:formate/nitrite transporter